MPQFLQRQIQRVRELPEEYEVIREEQGLFTGDDDDIELDENKE